MKRDHEDKIAAAQARKPTDWQRFANCVGIDPDLFFADQDDQATNAQAKALCRRCAVRDACLRYSNTYPVIIHGTWGGQTEAERREMRRTQRLERSA